MVARGLGAGACFSSRKRSRSARAAA
jgi:hypothetical protein